MRITKAIVIDKEINECLKNYSKKTGIPQSRIIEKLLLEKFDHIKLESGKKMGDEYE